MKVITSDLGPDLPVPLMWFDMWFRYWTWPSKQLINFVKASMKASITSHSQLNFSYFGSYPAAMRPKPKKRVLYAQAWNFNGYHHVGKQQYK